VLSWAKQAALAAGVAAVVAGGWVLAVTQNGDAVQEMRNVARGPAAPAQVRVEPVGRAATVTRYEGIGTAEAARSVVLFPQGTGSVIEVAFRAGETVRRGEVVVRLDDDEQRVALERARIDVQEAEQTVGRYERLEPSGAVSAAQADQARLALALARTDVSAAELALERRVVRAPFEGTIGLPRVSEGERIDAGTPLVSLDDRSTLLVDFEVPERLAGLVAPGQEIAATTPSLRGRTVEGVLEASDSRLDPATRSLKVRARLPNDDDLLRPGMSFTIRLDFEGGEHPAVPNIAVQWDRDGAYVWRVSEDEVAERVPVTILQRQGGRAAVEGDVAPGDRIVTEGLQRLREGRQVAVRDSR
jgi:RND family efflux transporter MFP subunit